VAASDGVPSRSEHGFSLVAAAASITMMMLLMGMAMPTWRYVMQNAREEELLFRGGQIADAIGRYQKKHGNAPPVSLEVLVKGKFLRKAYADPMTEDGRWKFIRPGETVGLPGFGGAVRPGQPGPPTPSPTPTPRAGRGTRPGSSSSSGAALGPFMGVASLSKDKSLRVFNGRTRYDQWHFIVGQPRVVGKDMHLRALPGVPQKNPRDNPRPSR
jgi:type II secretory pathway pseudopilin PulG